MGRSGASFGRSWALFASLVGRLESIHLVTLVQVGLQEPVGIDFGTVLGGFGEDLGGFGRVLGPIWEVWGRVFGSDLGVLGRFGVEDLFRWAFLRGHSFGSVFFTIS